jgi:hypothetical protein
MPEQTQNIFNIYADQNLFILVGDENITTYSISDRTLLNQIDNSRPQKQHRLRQSLISFHHKTIYEIKYDPSTSLLQNGSDQLSTIEKP